MACNESRKLELQPSRRGWIFGTLPADRPPIPSDVWSLGLRQFSTETDLFHSAEWPRVALEQTVRPTAPLERARRLRPGANSRILRASPPERRRWEWPKQTGLRATLSIKWECPSWAGTSVPLERPQPADPARPMPRVGVTPPATRLPGRRVRTRLEHWLRARRRKFRLPRICRHDVGVPGPHRVSPASPPTRWQRGSDRESIAHRPKSPPPSRLPTVATWVPKPILVGPSPAPSPRTGCAAPLDRVGPRSGIHPPRPPSRPSLRAERCAATAP